jgi:hypothetical protein
MYLLLGISSSGDAAIATIAIGKLARKPDQLQ